jgi:UDP-N-acetyl-2-amino-2-deoxyglucuronate dehydrogenase
VCDYREPRARRMGEAHGSPYWLDFDRFLDESQIQALHICSPTGHHADQGIAAAERGIHVLCEKPLDLDISKVDLLIETCDRRDVRLGCIFQRRAVLAAQTVQKSIADGRMGRLLSCSVSVKWWRSQEYYDKDLWRGTWSLDGGALANQGIHSLDQMVWMAGPVEAVDYAHIETANHRIEAEDFAIAVVRFVSGARGTIEATTCCRPDLATRLEIYGTRGSAALEDARVIKYGLDGIDMLPTLTDKGVLTGGGEDPWNINLSGHRTQIEDFYLAVAEHRSPAVDGREARNSVDLLNKIYRFARPPEQ